MSTLKAHVAPAAKIVSDLSSNKWLKLKTYINVFQSQKQKRSDHRDRSSPVVSQVQNMPRWTLLFKFSDGFSHALAVSISAFCHACSLQQHACEPNSILVYRLDLFESAYCHIYRWTFQAKENYGLVECISFSFCFLLLLPSPDSCYFFSALFPLPFLNPCNGLLLPLHFCCCHLTPLSSQQPRQFQLQLKLGSQALLYLMSNVSIPQ